MGSILAFIGGAVVAFGLAVYRGFMLSTFWAWFVMPVFKGVPSIGIAAACGMTLLVAALTHQKNTADERQGFSGAFIEGFIKTTLYLGIGWCIKLFM